MRGTFARPPVSRQTWLFVFVFLLGCSARQTPRSLAAESAPEAAPLEPVAIPEGGFRLSIVPTPTGDVNEWGQWVAAYKQAHDLGCSVAHTYTDWVVTEPSAGQYKWGEIDYFFTLAKQQQMQVSMQISIIDINTLGKLPKDLKAKSLKDPKLKERFLTYVEAFAKKNRGNVDYLWLGNEVDIYLDKHPDELDAWVDIFRQAVAIVHREAPGVKVGLSMTYHTALGNGRTDWIHKWGPYCDIVAVTFYPEMMPGGFQPDSLQAQFDGLVRAYGQYRLAIIETAVGATGEYGGGEAAQVRYCTELFKALRRHKDRFAFVGWYTLNDYPEEWLAPMKAKFEDQALGRWFSALSMASHDGKARPVMRTWAEEARKFYATSGR